MPVTRRPATDPLVGLILGLISAPLTFVLLDHLTRAFGHVREDRQPPSPATLALLALAACLVIAPVWWNRRSAVGSATAGAVLLVLGCASILDVTGDGVVRDAVQALADAPIAIVLAVVLLGASGATMLTRHLAHRRVARRDAARRDTARRAAAHQEQPRSGRVGVRLVSLAAGLVTGPVSIVLYAGFTSLLRSRNAEGDSSLSVDHVGFLLQLAFTLAILYAAGSLSATGPVVAGAVWLLVGGSSLVRPITWENPVQEGVREAMGELLGFVSWMEAEWFGAVLVIGATLVAAGLVLRAVRRDALSDARTAGTAPAG